MKKEKTVRTYQRRTKTGKIVTVKQHTAKYDAAEALKEAAKKKGAGDEMVQKKLDAEWKKIEDAFMKEHPDFEAFDDEGVETKENAALTKKMESFKRKHPEWTSGVGTGMGNKKKVIKSPKESKASKEAKSSDSGVGFTADEYKAWYHWDTDADPKNAAAKKVEKALKAKMGAKGYKKYFDEMTDSYSSRGHNKAFKALDSSSSKETKALEQRSKDIAKMVEGQKAQMKKAGIDPDKRLSGKKATEAKKDLVSKGFTQKKDEYGDTYLMKGKDVYHYIPSGVVMGGAKLDKITGGKDYDKAKKLFGEKSVTPSKASKGSKSVSKEAEDLGSPKGQRFEYKYGNYIITKEGQVFTSTGKKVSKKMTSNILAARENAKKMSSRGKKNQHSAASDDTAAFKAFLKLPKPEKGSKGYAAHMALRSAARWGGASDDTLRDALVRNGYPSKDAYSKGIKEVIALAKKHKITL